MSPVPGTGGLRPAPRLGHHPVEMPQPRSTLRRQALALLLGAAALAAPAPARADDEVAVGLPAPGFSLKTLNPEVAGAAWFRLDQWVGEEPDDPAARLVILSFFASWCGPCQKELKLLVELDARYRAQGLRVVSVSIDQQEEGIAAARRMAAAAKVGYPVLSDRFNVLARRYLGQSSPLPSVFLLGRDGTLLRIEKGYAQDAAAFLTAEVQSRLALGRAAAP